MNKLTKLKNTSFHLENIFAVQCRLVGANYNEVDRTKEDWFMEYKWSRETEEKFIDWMKHYIHKIKGAQRELYGHTFMKIKDCEMAARAFVLNYGWSTCKT